MAPPDPYLPSDMLPQIRQDPITGQHIIYAPGRGARPNRLVPPSARLAAKQAPTDPSPFEPGQEHRIPEILLERPGPDGEAWQTRVVPNKYPMLTATAPDPATDTRFHPATAATGRHEVIIESPDPADDLATMSPAAVTTVIDTYLQRYRTLREAGLLPFLFRNHKAAAGASLRHPHAQIIGLPFAPEAVRRQEEHARRYHTTHGRCGYCDIAAREEADAVRIVEATDHFLVFVPYAAEAPFELWILPRQHRADLADLPNDEQAALAEVLRTALHCLNDRLEDPAYNLVFHTPLAAQVQAPHLHWYLRIQLRLQIPGGFELGTGVPVNASLPEHDAAFLRGEPRVYRTI